SHTFPAISTAPKGLSFLPSYRRTGVVPSLWQGFTELLQRVQSHSLPQGYMRPSSPCAAYCHWSSVGSIIFSPVTSIIHRQKATASYHVTPTTGYSAPFHRLSFQKRGAVQGW